MLKFTCTYAALLEARKLVCQFVSTNARFGAVCGVLVEAAADGDQLVLTGTNHDCWVSVRVPARAASGTLLVDAHELKGLLAAAVTGLTPARARDLPLTLEASDPLEPTLALNGYTVPLTAHALADYPARLAAPAAVAELDGAHLVAAVLQTETAAFRDQSLPMLCCTQIAVSEGRVTCTATNRYRVVVVPVAARTGALDGNESGLVDAKLLKRLAGGLGDGAVTLGWQGGDCGPVVAFSSTGMTLVFRAMPGDIPVRRLFADAPTGRMTVAREELLKAVERSGAIAAIDAGKEAVVLLRPADGRLRVLPAQTGSQDEVDAPAIAVELDGDLEGRELKLKASHLVASLKGFAAERVTLHQRVKLVRIAAAGEDPSDAGIHREAICLFRTEGSKQ